MDPTRRRAVAYPAPVILIKMIIMVKPGLASRRMR